MKMFMRMLVLLIGLAGLVEAAQITLKDGRVIEGELLSSQGDKVVINAGGIEMTLPKSSVAAIDFTAGASAPAVTPAPAAPAAQAAAASVPAGTPLTIRLSDTLDSRRTGAGQRFSGVLEADLVAGAVVVAPRGSRVYGRVVQAKKSGRLAGTAAMTLELTEIMVNNQMKPVLTNQMVASGESTGKTSAGRTARGAVIGGLIDGSSGAKTGAKVGLGASILTAGNDIQIPRGTLLDFRLQQPFHP